MGVQLFAGKYFKVRAIVFQDNQKQTKKTIIKNPIPKQNTNEKYPNQNTIKNKTNKFRKVRNLCYFSISKIQAAIN